MDEHRVVELMRQFFDTMQTTLVSEVVNKLTEVQDSISESSSEKETIPVGDNANNTPPTKSSPTPGGSDRRLLLKNGDIVLVPFDCETLFKEVIGLSI